MPVLYLGPEAGVEVIDRGVCVTGSAGRLSLVSARADVLFRLAASLMVAADEIDTVNASTARHLVGVGVPH